jgi:cytochrome P450
MMVAGHDTTAATVACALCALCAAAEKSDPYEARSTVLSHTRWSPYDPVRAVNADP